MTLGVRCNQQNNPSGLQPSFEGPVTAQGLFVYSILILFCPGFHLFCKPQNIMVNGLTKWT